MTPDIVTFFKLAAERIDANGGTVPDDLWLAVSGGARPAPIKAKVKQPLKLSEDQLRKQRVDRLVRKHLFGQNN